MEAVKKGSRKPTNPQTDAYRKYLEKQRNRGPGAVRKDGRTPEEKYWDQWKKDNTPEGLSDYMKYKDPGGGAVKVDDKYLQEKSKWEQFEQDTFGGTPEAGKGTGEGGRYTVDDLYIKTSDKRWKDKQRDLMIDPNKKGGGGRRGGSRKTGGKTGGPGNPNTGGGGGGAGDANL